MTKNSKDYIKLQRMLSSIHVYNFPTGTPIANELQNASSFILATCQRTLVLSTQKIEETSQYPFEHKKGKEAYAYLLEIICGLQSKLIGENEIVSQFKTAYRDYSKQDKETRDSNILRVLEKLFQDSKDIRTKYLIGLSQKTYSSLARKILLSKHHAKSVLILGSGQLAEDMINQLKKKVPVYIVARNQEKVKELKEKHFIESCDWNDVVNKSFNFASEYSFIVNTIGCKHEVLTSSFFEKWEKHQEKCFVDLASPSPYKEAPVTDSAFYKLDDIFELGAIHEEKKQKQINKAKSYLESVALKREMVLRKKITSTQSNFDYLMS